MSIIHLIEQLRLQGVKLTVVDNNLKAKLPHNFSPELKTALVANKKEIKAYIFNLISMKANDTKSIISRQNLDIALLSFAQQRLWFIDQLQSGSPEYNMPVAFQVTGQLNLQRVNDVFTVIIQRHQVLRSHYIDTGDGVRQCIRDRFDFILHKHDLSGLPAQELQTSLQCLLVEDASKHFDLREDLMLRVSYILLQHADEANGISHKGVLLFNMHHIASDGWSMEVLTKEFFTLYHAFSEGKANPLPALAIQYADYAHWQKQSLAGEVIASQLRYWQTQLADLPLAHSLPLAHARPEVKQSLGGKVTGTLSQKTAVALQTVAKQHQLTPFMLMHAALAIVLSRHSNSQDIVIGTPVANRMQAELEPLIGFFVNTLVLRLDTEHYLFSDYLSHVRQVHLAAQSHQDAPFEQLVERLNVARSTALTPLFQVMLTTSSDYGLSKEDAGFHTLPGINISPLSSGVTTAKFDLDIDISLNEEGVFTRWTYDKALFSSEQVETFNEHLCFLLESIADCSSDNHAGQLQIKDLSMLSSTQHNSLLELANHTIPGIAKESCIHVLFEQTTEINFDKTALVFEGETISYGQLNEKANSLAHYLIDNHHIKPGSLVGICVERSLEMVIGILAILKAGGAYVPLDPQSPPSRLDYMLTDAGLELVLTQARILSEVDLGACTPLLIDDAAAQNNQWAAYTGTNIDNAVLGLTTEHLAYVIYTSGSTGLPKGVMSTHANAAALANELELWSVCDMPQSWGWFANYNFDASLQGLLRLMTGQSLVVLPGAAKTSPELLVHYIKDNHIGVLDCTPAMVSMWFDAGIESALPNLIIGGEAISSILWRQLVNWQNQTGTIAVNVYGPTEACVNSTYTVIEGEIPNIGRQLSYVSGYVMDKQMSLVPENCIGELHLGGAGLARGYLNNPTLTKERFVTNPYYDKDKGNSSQRLYKTGDLVRYLPGGRIAFIGRIDEQVKIRGFRIELGEIEHQLIELPEVDSALVQAKDVGTGELQLVAYVKLSLTREIEQEETVALQRQCIARLKQALVATLPDYMIPGIVVLLDVWPLTPNGKIDKRSLPEADGAFAQEAYLAPTTDTEKALVQVWSELLAIDSDKISVDANFFELGGHSLLTVRLVSEIRKQLAVELAVKMVFEANTIRTLAQAVDNAVGNQLRQEIIPINHINNESTLSFAQQRLWFIDQLQSGSPEYNMPVAFQVTGQLNLQRVNDVFTVIIQRHQVLRSHYIDTGDGVRQCIRDRFDFILHKHDLSGLPAQELQTSLQCLLVEDASKHFDLREDLMLRVSYILLQHADEANGISHKGVLLFNMHHIASDGWSMEVLTKEFFTLYHAFSEGKANPLPALAIQYADYAHWQKQSLAGEVIASQLRYWQTQLADLPLAHSLPLAHARPEVKQSLGGKVTGTLSQKTAVALQTVAKQHQLTPFMLMHAALAIVLSRHSNSQDIVIGTPVANRMQAELEPLIGFFVNTLVLRLDTEHYLFSDYLSHVRQVHLAAQSHQDAPFEQLVERLNVARSTALTPLFQVMLTTSSDYGLSKEDAGFHTLPGINISPLSSGVTTAKFDLDIDISLNEEGVFTRWTYDKALFSSEQVETFNEHLCFLLESIADCSSDNHAGQLQIKDLSMLSSTQHNSLLELANHTIPGIAKESCIHVLFEQTTEINFDKTALVFEGETISYGQLNEKANSLAHYLIDNHHIKPGSLVGICVERSLEMVIGILAILKAGGAYVPLDPQSPPSRLDYMLTDAGLELVLTQARILSEVDLGACTPLLIDDAAAQNNQWAAYTGTNIDNAVLGLTTEHLAYVIYTSGSTGLPKGVMSTHANAAALANELELWSVCDMPQSWGWFANYNFDASLQGLLRLMTGQSLVVLPGAAKTSPELLVHYIKDNHIGVLDCTPAMVSMWFDAGIESALPNLIIGGEAISSILWRQLVNWQNQTGTIAVNVYGPTEACVNSTYTVIEGEIPNIGRQLSYVSGYVMDKQMSLVPENCIGELHLGGAGLARGYLNNPTLTKERFVTNPYYDKDKGNSSQRLYKTGDLVRYLPGGRIAFIGRIDEQVKIRGFRIELGEIEHQLIELPEVDSALVQAKDVGTGELQLVAYVKLSLTREIEQEETVALQRQCIARLKQALVATLPDYMIPGIVVLLDVWPLTPNGKIDKRSLPEADGAFAQEAYLAPTTDTEKALVQVWSELLAIDSDKISVDANFFELGGHSLLTVRLVSEIRGMLNSEVSIKNIFEFTTLNQLSSYIDHKPKVVLEESRLVALGEHYYGNTAVYCIPGVAGLANSFTSLSKQLSKSMFNTWAFNHPGILDDSSAFTSINRSVDCFVNAIIKHEINKTFFILGHSYGGALALEISRRLQSLGYKVQLILLDSYFEQALLMPSVRKESEHHYSCPELVQDMVSNSDLAFRDNLIKVSQMQAQLFDVYKPSPLKGIRPLIVFAEGAQFYTEQYLVRLSKVFPDGYEHTVVHGNHFSMLTGVGARQISVKLQSYMADKSLGTVHI